ncbi:MAG: uracil-DNA glycosylase [Deltaproteobacteria bacterium]|jgi:hypothetical protein|nr:uracil-DNA glycosylase [Deltaproteobacteria bacterium]
MNTPQRPICGQCKHYYITWEKKHPYGCKKWNFKSAVMPSISVYKASGTHCQVFEKKG